MRSRPLDIASAKAKAPARETVGGGSLQVVERAVWAADGLRHGVS